MRQSMTFLCLFTKAILNLASKTVQLFAKRCQQAVQALAILLIYAAIAVLEYTVRQIFKLLAQALFAVDHLTDLIFRMLLRCFQPGSDFTEISFQRGVDTVQAAQFVIKQFALITPVGFL